MHNCRDAKLHMTKDGCVLYDFSAADDGKQQVYYLHQSLTGEIAQEVANKSALQ